MTVHFIGAGPGAPDLLTLRGRDLIAASPVCLYAGSLVPGEVLRHCPEGARIINTAPLSLDEIIAEIAAAHGQGLDVARLHSGDLSVWSAMGEQLRRLRALGIPCDVTPGVPSFAASAAALGAELTLPGVAQSVVLTRTSGRASPMPPGETLAAFAATGATLAIHLSIHRLGEVAAELHVGVEDPFAPARKAHPAFVVDALDEVAARLRHLGFEVDESQRDTFPGHVRFHTFDGHGNRVEVLALAA